VKLICVCRVMFALAAKVKASIAGFDQRPEPIGRASSPE
jgi:hypothetical protein